MNEWWIALQVLGPAFWLGMVVAISFLEAPIKFRAPGVTIPIGLGIDRRVFRALNIAEIVVPVVLWAPALDAIPRPSPVCAVRSRQGDSVGLVGRRHRHRSRLNAPAHDRTDLRPSPESACCRSAG